jgi:hypothetical protein
MTVAVGARNFFKVDAGVVHTLLQARYYDGSKGEFLSEDASFVVVGNPRQSNRTKSSVAGSRATINHVGLAYLSVRPPNCSCQMNPYSIRASNRDRC